MNKIETALEENLIEREWELQRRFMHEVERELGLQVPAYVLMGCQNVVQKWLEYVRKN